MPRLRRALGLPSLILYAVGMILGAGIYSVIGAVAGLAGNALWFSFLLGAFVALFTGLSYAELSTMFPRAAAEYVFVREASGRRSPAAVIGVVLALAGAAIATTVSLAFAGYLRDLVPVPGWAAAIGLLAAATAVNLAGIRESARVNAVLTVIEVVGLLIVIGCGVGSPRFARDVFEGLGWGVLPGAALVFFAYLGFEKIANLAEEARNPARDVPRAILWSLAATTLLYVLVALAVVALVPAARLAGSDAPLAVAVATVSPGLAAALAVIALFATANTALVALLVASRVLMGMARAGDLPAVLGRIEARRGTPWAAVLAVFGAAAAMVPIGGVEAVAGLASFGALLAFGAVNVAVIVLRYRRPAAPRPFRIPGAIGRLPLVPVLGAISGLILLSQFDRATYLGGAAAIGAAWILHAAHRRAR